MTLKTCEGCGRNMVIPVPESAKLAQKYCPDCAYLAQPNAPLPDCSHMRPDGWEMFRRKPVESETTYGTDLNRRQKLQLQWVSGFANHLSDLERKQREMKIRQGGRYK